MLNRSDDFDDCRDEAMEYKISSVVNGKYVLLRKLGEGNFGTVFLAHIKGSEAEVAMKVEYPYVESPSLQIDLVLLTRLRDNKHICPIYGYGTYSKAHYIVMKVVGKTLDTLRRSNPTQRFSESTALRVGIQCVEAIEQIHSVGYLHRDFKPDNLAVDRDQLSAETIIVLDFGMSRRYIRWDGRIRQPRHSPGFRGTSAFASIKAHRDEDLGRVDDMWSVIYTLIELLAGKLPWARLSDSEMVTLKKELFKTYYPENIPRSFSFIFNHLRKMEYIDQPQYAWIRGIFDSLMQRRKYDYKEPFDWQFQCLELYDFLDD